MFPLGTVLLPYMPLRLRVFEQRYLIMLSELLKGGVAEFGVVLIERGQEVGGGEQRFAYGTVAEITSMGTSEGFLGLVAEGRERFEVQQWLPEEPHPRAEVRLLPALGWDPELIDLLAEAERSRTAHAGPGQRVPGERVAGRHRAVRRSVARLLAAGRDRAAGSARPARAAALARRSPICWPRSSAWSTTRR